MDVTLWIAASILALAFLASGASKLAQSREQLVARGYGWAEDFSPAQVRLIGTAEILGAVGLVVPAALGVLDVLSPAAATALAVLMAGAVMTHVRRGERAHVGAAATLAVLTAVLAVLRFGPYPF